MLQRSTFQVVLATDGTETFAMFNYEELDLTRGSSAQVNGRQCFKAEVLHKC